MMWPWTMLMYMVGIGNFANFSFLSVVELILFSFPINFFIYGLNDLYDSKSDRINERKQGVQGFAPTDEEMVWIKKIVWIPGVVFCIVSFFSWDIQHVFLAIFAMILPVVYSHPKVIRAKEIPIFDCFVSGAGYCMPALLSYSLHGNILNIPPYLFLILLPFAGIHAITTLLDVDVDKAAGMRTTGTTLGKNKTIIFLLLIFFVATCGLWEILILRSIFFVGTLLAVIFLFTKNKRDESYFLFSASAVMISFMMLGMLFFIFQSNS